MKMSMDFSDLYDYVERQMVFFFPDQRGNTNTNLGKSALELALKRTEECFKHILLNGYAENGVAVFNHLHSDQYSQFLYLYANSLWKLGAEHFICDKLLYLNRILHGLFVSYKCSLPEHFVFGHPVGTVIGNAAYSDFLVIFQNVTINTAGTSDNELPKLGKGLFLGAGSKIIGSKTIGDRVSVGVNAHIHNLEVPDDAVVISRDGKTEICTRKKETCFAQNYFDIEIE